jgi:colanic acid/amylovoran biosynthesis glycosyltransferase
VSANERRHGTRHIGYVLKRFPRISETFVAAEIIELERQGERVSIFAVSRPDEPFSHDFIDQIKAPVTYLPYRPLRQLGRVARSLARVLHRDARGWLNAAAVSLWPPRLVGIRHLLQATVLRDELHRAGVTHVHAHFATTAARLANLAQRMGGPTYSVTAHAKDIYHRDVRIEHLRDKLSAALFVATVTQANHAYLQSVLGDGTRLRVIHNAVDLRRLPGPDARRPDPELILSVGRLVEKKGLVDLVQACGVLAQAGTPVRLEIVGDGPLRTELEAEAARSGARVVFHGALPNERVVELYRRATVFSLPCVVASTGDRDALPTSILEAMALGVPVVTTAVNGLGELVIDGETGLVVAERDPAGLARAIGRLLSDGALAEQLAESGRRHVEREFSLERSVSALRAQFPTVG